MKTKTWCETTVGKLTIIIVVSLFTISARAQQSNSLPAIEGQFVHNPAFAQNPGALELITNLLAEPPPELSVPSVSQTWSPPGTYWTLTQSAPLPMDMFPDLPVYEITTNQYLIDDRSVDYPALQTQLQAEYEAEGITNPVIPPYSIDTNGLWIQVPTNSLATPGCFTVNVMNTLQGQSYDIFTTPNLSCSWATEMTVTGAVGNVTPITLSLNNRNNLFVRARTSVAYSFYLITEPLSQDVASGDTVTFYVETGGNTNLTYQWTFNGVDISGATNSTYTIQNFLQASQTGDYACIISDGTNSIVTAAAQLTWEGFSEDRLLFYVVGPRQDYTFRSGYTYYIGSPIQLYGHTTIEAGAVLKFDFDNSTNSSLIVMGGLTCKTTPYNPAILTSIDDDSAGEWLFYSTGSPQAIFSGVPYLDLTAATNSSISNLRFLFADWGVTTPVNTPWLDIWDCQFVQCNYGVVNLVAGNSTNSLHNVLFAGCEAGIGASTNSITIYGEQVTADVGDFCLASSTPDLIALTNSIVWGNPLSASLILTNCVAMNPDPSNSVSVGEGDYYLATNSPLHNAGITNISPRLLYELQGKTTYPPVAITPNTQVSGQMTFSPQVPRYTGGPPDLGYYYDALDYTLGPVWVAGGTVAIVPGTAICIDNAYIPSTGNWTDIGFYVSQGGSIISQGTPNQPNIFTAADLVQEQPNINFAEYQVSDSQYYGAYFDDDWLPGIVSFVTDGEPGDTASPTLNFRYCDFYLPQADLNIASGMSFDSFWIFSASSSVNLTLQDCSLHNGQINLGQPDDSDFAQDQIFGTGAVIWKNTLFENVNINLDPTFYEDGSDDQGLNVDLSLQAYNNLFRGGQWLHLEPIPASAGDWVFEDNLFDEADVIQDTESGQFQPLDYDYNGYWPLSTNALTWDYYQSPWYSVPNTEQLQPTVTTNGFEDGLHEVTLVSPPPYQYGLFGNYYLPNTTLLYNAGSATPAALGLYHYTTQTNQLKEGNEPSGHMANIGLHYIAANSSGQPVDTDGDGIPDYLEDANGNGIYDPATESDWLTPETNGVYFIGLTNGQVLSGIVTIPVEIYGQETDQVMDAVFSSSDELALFGGSGYNNFTPWLNWQLLWDTEMMSNGTYTISPEADFISGDSAGGSEISITISNEISFPNWVPEFGELGNGLLIRATSATTNVDWNINIYDSQYNYIGSLTGYSADGDIYQPWDLTGPDGVQHTNDNFFIFVITTDDTPQDASAVTPPIYKRLENWYGRPGGWVCVEQQYFSGYLGASTLYAEFNDFISAAMAQNWQIMPSLNPQTDQNQEGSWENYPLNISSDWQLFTQALTNQYSRNVLYFGHGGPNILGLQSQAGLNVTSDQIGALLNNIPSGQTNSHSYRFVWLDGCSTALGNWPEAFGIWKKSNVPPDDYDDANLRYSAFIGWPKNKDIAYGGYDGNVDQPHITFVQGIQTEMLGAGLTDDGTPQTLSQAIANVCGDDVEYNLSAEYSESSLTVYGCSSVRFFQNN